MVENILLLIDQFGFSMNRFKLDEYQEVDIDKILFYFLKIKVFHIMRRGDFSR